MLYNMVWLHNSVFSLCNTYMKNMLLCMHVYLCISVGFIDYTETSTSQFSEICCLRINPINSIYSLWLGSYWII